MSTQIETNVGVAAALSAATPRRTVFAQYSLVGRVAMVTGGLRGIGLETALALAEAGATVYCIDIASEPDAEWLAVQKYAASLPSIPLEQGGTANGDKGKLEYLSGDVTNQEKMWKLAENIVEKEGRIDICHANAGILNGAECLEYPAAQFQKLYDVNVNGVLFTAQAAGRQMKKLGIKGSIILTGSMSGSITNPGQHWVAYNSSKSAVLQMARSMACELGPLGIRVNTISPGYIYTAMTRAFLEPQPELMKAWNAQNPLGRLGRPDELRGAILWLAGDGSTFCTGSDIVVDGGQCAW